MDKKKSLKDMIEIEQKLVQIKDNSKKNEQIIIRLPLETKEKLQEVADSLGIDMSKLVRNKIDEIIAEHELYIQNKRITDETKSFITNNSNILTNRIITEGLIEDIRNEFRNVFMAKIKEEILSTDISKFISSFTDEEKRDVITKEDIENYRKHE